MASKTQEEILKRFEAIARQPSEYRPAEETAIQATAPRESPAAAPIMSMPEIAAAAATTAGQNVKGGSPSATSTDSGSSITGTVLKDIFETGLGVVPLIGGLMGLFGGGPETPPPPVKYQMPSRVSFMSADVGHDLVAGDYDQMGLPRAYEAPAYNSGAYDSADWGAADASYYSNPLNAQTSGNSVSKQPASGAAVAPQITVNVQAMDAQSFLDRSTDIAQAVRSAMLNMSSINDVVSEL